MAQSLYKRDEHQLARRFAEKALISSSEATLGKADTIDLLGSIYATESDELKAEQMKYRAFRMREQYYQRWNIVDPGIADACVEMAKFYEAQKRFHLALGFYRYAMEIYQNSGGFLTSAQLDTSVRIAAIERKLGA